MNQLNLRSYRAPVFGAVLVLVILVIGLVYFSFVPAQENAEFKQWVTKVWPKARAQGVSRKTFDQAFEGVVPDPEVLASANEQPEFVKPVWEYLDTALSEKRITEGRDLLRTYKPILTRLEKKFGVDRHILVAIWGLESAYGTHMGDLYVIRSLATLAYEGERRKFGFAQLISALKILERGDIPVTHFQGSWAGAMGQTQFIPTTYNAYAVDEDGDGRRNIWTSVPDALASTANYLRASKWQINAPVVIEVKLPVDFNFKHTGLKHARPMAQWVKMGIKDVNGGSLKSSAKSGAVIVPAGANGPAFIAFNNFRSILRYNNAIPYALAVSLLAKRFQGNGKIESDWPLENLPLSPVQSKELQRILSGLGHKVGKIDGMVGSNTIKAIKAYQSSKGLKADGYPGLALLNRLRKG